MESFVSGLRGRSQTNGHTLGRKHKTPYQSGLKNKFLRNTRQAHAKYEHHTEHLDLEQILAEHAKMCPAVEIRTRSSRPLRHRRRQLHLPVSPRIVELNLPLCRCASVNRVNYLNGVTTPKIGFRVTNHDLIIKHTKNYQSQFCIHGANYCTRLNPSFIQHSR